MLELCQESTFSGWPLVCWSPNQKLLVPRLKDVWTYWSLLKDQGRKLAGLCGCAEQSASSLLLDAFLVGLSMRDAPSQRAPSLLCYEARSPLALLPLCGGGGEPCFYNETDEYPPLNWPDILSSTRLHTRHQRRLQMLSITSVHNLKLVTQDLQCTWLLCDPSEKRNLSPE